jgi:hypothetical protein
VIKAGYFETSGSDYGVTQRKYRLLIRVELVLNGISTERKPGVGVERLQCRGSSRRNVIKPPFVTGNCVMRKAKLYYTKKILEVFIFINLAHCWKQIRVYVTLFIIKKRMLLHKMKEHILYKICNFTLYVQEKSLPSEKNSVPCRTVIGKFHCTIYSFTSSPFFNC